MTGTMTIPEPRRSRVAPAAASRPGAAGSARRLLALTLLLQACLGPTPSRGPGEDVPPPNVLLIVTDDQGAGDFGVVGNPLVDTPRLDALAAASARVDPFYVSPVCAPTRASLMTGRWHLRTGVTDTWIGRALMRPDERTLAELLGAAGWRTGLFGKWHLGDVAPLRPGDQGFDRSVVHRGGGIGQPSDPPGGEGAYSDPVLLIDGELTPTRGYCTEVFADAALAFARESVAAGQPFLAVLTTNAPHGPFDDVPADLLERYRERDLSPAAFPPSGDPSLPPSHDEERLARIFAMISDIDRQVGRLLDGLDELGVADDTLVIFLVDNGPNTRRWQPDRRGMKGEVWEGGVRSPLWVRWPARIAPGERWGTPVAHVDLLPTVLAACGVAPPDDLALDGVDLLARLTGEDPGDDLPPADRPVVIQAHRGDAPVYGHNAMIRQRRWKLVHPSGFGAPDDPADPPTWQLYDLYNDPYELSDVAAEHPAVVSLLVARYDAWFADVTAAGFEPVPLWVGAPDQGPVHLTRQDWRQAVDRGWGGRSEGAWWVDVRHPGPYEVVVRAPPGELPERAELRWGDERWVAGLVPGHEERIFRDVVLTPGTGWLRAELFDLAGGYGAYQVELRPGR